MPTHRDEFPGFMVREMPSGTATSIESLSFDDWPETAGPSVDIGVEYSSFNYKDALACRGDKGVAPKLPHVPGIDCAGTVLRSDSPELRVGDPVLVTGYGLGASHWGGYAGRVRVPSDWVVPMPAWLDARSAMIYGTAGFTAAQCVMAIHEKVAPDAGEVIVTGSTGGVGLLAVAILAKLGYRVTAVTGKSQWADRLKELGASEVVGREAISDTSERPLLSAKWSAAVDTVGGDPLTVLLRSVKHRGVVAACGLVAGSELPLTVFPFLLRGVTLAGIDSAKCPREPRLEVWRRLAGDWRVDLPDDLVTTIGLEGLEARCEQILAGRVAGRTLVRPQA